MPPTTRSSGGLKLAPQWDEDSDLTDVEDSDEETEEPVQAPPPPQQPHPQPEPQQGPARRSARKSTQQATEERQPAISKDEGPLPPYNMSNPSIDQIAKLIEADLIVLEPDYQRDVVWNAIKQTNLIDSIYRNYPVPNLVFVRVLVDGEWSRVCIDGKQRLTSIKKFMNGEIGHRDPVTKKLKWFMKTSPNQRRVLVSEEWKRKFLAKQMTFYDYENITPSQERMIFQRVQLGTILTPAERLQAANGGCADFLRELRNCVCSTQVFSNFGEWGESKGKNFLALSQIVYLVETKKLPPSLPDPDKLGGWLEGSLKNTAEIKECILLAFNIFGRLSLHEKYGPWLSTQGVTPVEFVMAIYAIVIFMHDITDCKLADGIRKMWDADRSSASKGKGAKAMKESYVKMRDFVDKMAKVKKIDLEEDPTELVNSADMPPLSEEQISMLCAAERPSNKTSVKRSRSVISSASKRARTDDAESDDEAPLSRLKKGSTSKPPAPKKPKLSKSTKKANRVEPDEEDDDGDVIPTIPVPKRERVPKAKGAATRKPSNVPARGSTAPKPSAAALRVKRPPNSSTPAPTPPPPSAPIPSASSSKIPSIKIPAPSSLKPPVDPRVGGREAGSSKNVVPVCSQPNTSSSRTAPLPPDFGNGGAAQSISSVSATTTITAAAAASGSSSAPPSFPPLVPSTVSLPPFSSSSSAPPSFPLLVPSTVSLPSFSSSSSAPPSFPLLVPSTVSLPSFSSSSSAPPSFPLLVPSTVSLPSFSSSSSAPPSFPLLVPSTVSLPSFSSSSLSPIVVPEPLNTSTAGVSPVISTGTRTEALKRLRGRVEERNSQRAASTPLQTTPTIPSQVPPNLVQQKKYPTPPGDGFVGDGQSQHGVGRKANSVPGSAPGGSLVGTPVQPLTKNQVPPAQTMKNQSAAQSTTKNQVPVQTSTKNQNSAQTPVSRPPATASSSGQQQAQAANRQQHQQQQQRQPSAPVSTEPSGPDEVVKSLRSKKGSYGHMKFSKNTPPPPPQDAAGPSITHHHTGTQPNSRASESEPPFTFDGWVESISIQANRLQQEQQQHQQSQAVSFLNSNMVPLSQHPDAPLVGYTLKRKPPYSVEELQGSAKRVNTGASVGSSGHGNCQGQGSLGLDTPPPSAGPLGFVNGRTMGQSQANATVDPRLQQRATGGR